MTRSALAQARRAAAAAAAFDEWRRSTGKPPANFADEPSEVQDMWLRIASVTVSRYANYPRADERRGTVT